MYYNYALDSLYENDILESVPVAPGEQSLCEQAAAAARALEPSHKCKQRGSAPSAAVALASWRRRAPPFSPSLCVWLYRMCGH